MKFLQNFAISLLVNSGWYVCVCLYVCVCVDYLVIRWVDDMLFLNVVKGSKSELGMFPLKDN